MRCDESAIELPERGVKHDQLTHFDDAVAFTVRRLHLYRLKPTCPFFPECTALCLLANLDFLKFSIKKICTLCNFNKVKDSLIGNLMPLMGGDTGPHVSSTEKNLLVCVGKNRSCPDRVSLFSH